MRRSIRIRLVIAVGVLLIVLVLVIVFFVELISVIVDSRLSSFDVLESQSFLLGMRIARRFRVDSDKGQNRNLTSKLSLG